MAISNFVPPSFLVPLSLAAPPRWPMPPSREAFISKATTSGFPSSKKAKRGGSRVFFSLVLYLEKEKLLQNVQKKKKYRFFCTVHQLWDPYFTQERSLSCTLVSNRICARRSSDRHHYIFPFFFVKRTCAHRKKKLHCLAPSAAANSRWQNKDVIGLFFPSLRTEKERISSLKVFLCEILRRFVVVACVHYFARLASGAKLRISPARPPRHSNSLPFMDRYTVG